VMVTAECRVGGGGGGEVLCQSAPILRLVTVVQLILFIQYVNKTGWIFRF
jgi:hypothetical protein